MFVFPAPYTAANILTTLSFVDSATSTGQTVTVPAGAQEGDFLLLYDFALDNSGQNSVPTDFTEFINNNEASTTRAILSGRIAPSGIGGTNITGMDANITDAKILLVFRGNAPITGFSFNDPDSEGTSGNPTAQTVTSSGGTPPFIVIGTYGEAGGSLVNLRTMSPAKDSEINVSGYVYVAWKIYDVGDTPEDVSVDMDDEGGRNVLMSGYLELT